ncbi:MAG: acylphosphatase [Patescibacteria group bacterium]
MNSKQIVKLKIYGRVQGVGFRISAKEQADAMGITGWITNTPGDTIECRACGNAPSLDKFLAWCKHGPKWANVEKVEVLPDDNQCPDQDFRVVY